MTRMSADRELNNLASWRGLESYIATFPNDAYWKSWKKSAATLLQFGVEHELDRYFRAGSAMHDIIFSTLEYNGLRDEPRVTLEIKPDGTYRIAYLHFGRKSLEYTLPLDQAFPTLRRFLNQLWKETMTEPIPEQLTGYDAPIICQAGLTKKVVEGSKAKQNRIVNTLTSLVKILSRIKLSK